MAVSLYGTITIRSFQKAALVAVLIEQSRVRTAAPNMGPIRFQDRTAMRCKDRTAHHTSGTAVGASSVV